MSGSKSVRPPLDLLRSALTTLRARFEGAAARSPGLGHRLVETSAYVPGKFAGPPGVPASERRKFSAMSVKYTVKSDSPDGQYPDCHDVGPVPPRAWVVQFIGRQSQEHDEFASLAVEAGRCLFALPIRPPAPPEAHDRIRERFPNYSEPQMKVYPGEPVRWVVFLHWLGWDGCAAPLLSARRQTWVDNILLPYDLRELDRLSSLLRTFQPGRAAEARVPDWFCSELPDVFLASCAALDWLLRSMEQAQPAGNRGGGRSAERAPGYRRGELDERATAELMSNPKLTNKQIASILGCHPNSLKGRGLTSFRAARALLKEGKEDYEPPGKGRNKEDGREIG